jgi:hypothetical protein
MKTANKLIITSVFLSMALFLAFAQTASAATQVILTGTNLGRVGTQFNTIAVGEGLTTNVYNHFGNNADTAAHLCALTEKYWQSLGLDKPYTAYISKAGLSYVACGNDYNYLWNSNSWIREGACRIGSMLKSVTCGAAASVTCTTNSQCGTDGFNGSAVCGANGDVYKNYTTYTCNNSGTSSSSCSHTDELRLFTDCSSTQTCVSGQCVNQNITCTTNSQCGTDGFSGSAVCGANGDVYKNYTTYTCNNAGTANSTCTHTNEQRLFADCTGTQTCTNGACVNQNITCSNDADCSSQNGYIGSPFCQTGNSTGIFQTYRTYTCQNPGTANSSCVGTNATQQKSTCVSNQVCTAGVCTTPANGFAIQSLAATNILTNSATLNAYLVNLGDDPSASVWFQWGPSTAYGFESSHQTMTLAGPVNQTIINLTPNAVYHFRAVAQNGSGVVYGSDMSFTAGNTLFNAQVQTLPATNIQPTSATLNGQVLSLGGDTSGTVWFQWGTSVAYGNQTSSQTMSMTGMFSQTISGLTANTTYQFRAVTQTTAGVIYGSNLSFTTTATGDGLTGLVVSSYATPNPATTNQQVSFIASATGATGSYTFSWSGACSGSGQVCNTTFTNVGTYTTTVTVTSGTQAVSSVATVVVGNSNNNNNCTYHSYQQCVGSYLYWYDSCGNQQGSQYCSNGCSNNYCQNYNNNIGALTINQTVRNLTNGSGFSSTVNAVPGDMLLFMITLQASGQGAQNVFVRDYLPSNLIYSNQLVISGSSYNYSGDITSGINLGTINAGQTVTVTYQVKVAEAFNFSYGSTTLNNNISVTSSNSNNPVNNASVVVTRSAVYGASTISTGLTNNFWVDSFFLPLLLTLICIWLWKSGMLFGIEKWINSKSKTRKDYKAEKELKNRIALIQETERA